MKLTNSIMIVLMMSSTAGFAWAEQNTATVTNADQMAQGGGRGGPGGGGGGRPQPQPVRPQPQPVRPQPQPVRPQPRPQPVRPQPQPVRPQPQPQPIRPQPVRPDPIRPEPVRPQPEPIRPQPIRPEPIRPEPIRPEPIPFRPGPGGRAYDPIPVHLGIYPGRHWEHPIFVRPVYPWEWANLISVTCSAEDSYGNIYPVTENEYAGAAYQAEMNNIEDAALDMCYDDSNGDTSCYLLGCNPAY